jgi:tRNA pseudouridine13 synthase
VTEEALALFNRILDFPHRKTSQYGVVKSEKPIDRASRTVIHQDIRRIFVSRLESYTESDGTFVLAAQSPQSSGTSLTGPKGKPSRGRGGRNQGQSSRGSHRSMRERFEELGGEYCHFSLYKENKDTMEVVSFIARQLETPPKNFQFAGTKDRRAVTVQRVSAHRIFADRLAGLNRKLRGSKLGNFAYGKHGLSLGDLRGNEFVITLRDCTFQRVDGKAVSDAVQHAEHVLKVAIENLVKDGFLNYYGLQRFGSFSMRTDTVGVKLLQGDYEGAVDTILHFSSDVLNAAQNPGSSESNYPSDDLARAIGIDMYRKTGKLAPALDKIPRKFSAEFNLIKFLGSKNHEKNFLGAIQMIPRNLRIMYAHAYQSSIWNYAASHRWSLAGKTLLEGDLVLVHEHKDKENNGKADDAEFDEDGEPIVHPSEDDRAITDDERFERARALSKEEVENGQYSIFDVVLPTPGFDVLYPSYMVEFYEELMGREEFGGLDPHSMRRSVKDLNLSGSYRKLLARPIGTCDYRVVPYTEENQQFAQTDLERLNEKHKQDRASKIDAPEHQSADSGLEKRQVDLETGLDGAMESKIQAVKDSLLGSAQASEDAEGGEALSQNNHEGEAPQAVEAPRAVAGEGDAMEIQEVHDVAQDSEKIAVILSLQLGASTYATMALREISKGGIRAYKPDFGGGR